MSLQPAQRLIDESTIEDLHAAQREAGSSAASIVRAYAGLLNAAALANSGDASAAAREIALCIGRLEDPRALFMAFQFYFRTGDLEAAERITRHRLAICAQPRFSWAFARAWSNLALILTARAKFTDAREAADHAVAISKAAGDERALARDLGTLAYVHEALGNDTEAERVYLESLAIAERLHACDLIATKLANLGDIAHRRGDLDRARELWTRALPLLTAIGKHQWATDMNAKIGSLPGT